MDKKILCSYTVTRYEDGSISVENSGKNGAPEIPTDVIYNDIVKVADTIKDVKLEEKIMKAIADGYTNLFYQITAGMKAAAEQKETTAEVEMPNKEE